MKSQFQITRINREAWRLVENTDDGGGLFTE